eukprot:GFYU01006086.1.p1 GENE.GFYU01006086.1~~GFYU01006086.1.p1  ORF type:complete len:242 (+),score=38.57 GFYU01006086.1:236-961(+)
MTRSADDQEQYTVYFDLDGTLHRYDMHDVILWAVHGLPSLFQRFLRLALFYLWGPILIFTGIFVPETFSAQVLLWICTAGLSKDTLDEVVNRVVIPKLHEAMIPEVLQDLKDHQAAGRKVAIISGNAEPLITAFCKELGVGCISTHVKFDPITHKYTGFSAGPVCVGDRKRVLVEEILSRTNAEKSELYAYGNSSNDAPFMSLCGNAFAVRPSSRLKRISRDKNWDDKFWNAGRSSYKKSQ